MRLRWIIVAVVIAVAGGVIFVQQRARMQREQHEAREAALREALGTMRLAIRNFHRDQQRYPRSLGELVPKYLPGIPADPMTGSPSWRLTTEETVESGAADFSPPAGSGGLKPAAPSAVVIIDVHSTAPGYSDY